MYSVTVCNQMKNKKYHTHCRNSSKIKYLNRRNRQNRYTNTHMTDPFPGLEQALRCKVVGLMDIKLKKKTILSLFSSCRNQDICMVTEIRKPTNS